VGRAAAVNALIIAGFFVFEFVGALCHSRRSLGVK